MNYKVGDKVLIRKDLKAMKHYGMWVATPEMEKMRGKDATITDVTSCGYDIKECGGWWTDEMIERKVDMFKAGDVVEYTGNGANGQYYPSRGTKGTLQYRSAGGWWVKWPIEETSGNGVWSCMESDLRLVERKVNMTKDDLKTGDLIIRRDGEMAIVMRDTEQDYGKTEFFIYKDGTNLYFDQYEDNLDFYIDKKNNYDIIKVYRGYCGDSLRSMNKGIVSGRLELIWQRSEKKHMSAEEAVRIIGEEGLRILKDKCGDEVVIDL